MIYDLFPKHNYTTIVVSEEGDIFVKKYTAEPMNVTYINDNIQCFSGDPKEFKFNDINISFEIPFNTDVLHALQLSKLMHAGQKYGKRDYFTYHICNVVKAVVKELSKDNQYTMIDSHKLITVAALHDIREDCFVPDITIRTLFGDEVANAVDAITYKRDTEDRNQYYNRILKNKLASFVKLKDAGENLFNCRIENDDKRAIRYEKLITILKGNKLHELKDYSVEVSKLANQITENIKQIITDIDKSNDIVSEYISQDGEVNINEVDKLKAVLRSSVIDIWSEYNQKLQFAIVDINYNKSIINDILVSTGTKVDNLNKLYTARYYGIKGIEIGKECIHNTINDFINSRNSN